MTNIMKGNDPEKQGSSVLVTLEEISGEFEAIDELEKTPWTVLSEEKLLQLRSHCEYLQFQGELEILDGIPYRMREDWLNKDLAMPDRAIKNISIDADEFREMADDVCDELAEYVIERFGENLHVVYPWRAALAFLGSFDLNGIKNHYHLGVYRDEKTVKPITYFPLDKNKFKDVGNGYVVVADPMLATGGSMALVIDQVIEMGISPENIICVSVVSAPEGVTRLANDYPGIKIVTAALDGRLNEFGYIVEPGLGDFGDKYFDSLDDKEVYERFAHCMTEEELEALTKRRQELAA